MNTPRCITALLICAGVASIMPAAALGQGPATAPAVRAATPLAGWKAAADPSDVKGKTRSDVRLTIPMKHGAVAARSVPGSPFVAVGDDNFSQDQKWFVADMRVGTFRPACVIKPVIEDAVISFGGEFSAGSGRPGGQGHEVQLWSVKTGQLLHRFPAPLESDVWVLGFGAGGRVIGFQKKDGEPTLPVWDPKTGAVLFTIAPGKQEGFGNLEAQQFAVSPGGRFVAVLSNENLHVYSTADGSEAGHAPIPAVSSASVFGPRNTVKGIAFSPDGGELAAFTEVDVQGTKNRIVAWDMASGRISADCTFGQMRDDRWAMRNDVKFEVLPDAKGWRFDREILDRATGQSVYTVLPAKEHQEGLLIKALDADHVFVVGQTEFGGGTPVATVTLPRAEMAKASAALQAGGKSIDAQLPPLTHVPWPATQLAAPAVPASTGPWTLKPDLVKLPALGSASIPLRTALPGREELRPTRVVFSGVGANSAAVSYAHGSGEEVRSTTIDRVPLAGGTPATFDVAGAADVMDLSADGSSFVLRTQEDRIDVYAQGAGPAAKPVVAFRPYETPPAPPAPTTTPSGHVRRQFIRSDPADEQKIAFAALLDSVRLLTANKAGLVVLWGLPRCQAIWSMQTEAGVTPCLSPGRKQLAVSVSGSTVFLDAASGASLGVLPPMLSESSQISISPDGARFARYEQHSGDLIVVNLATGQTISECMIKSGTNGIYWCGNSHLLISGTTLVDLELRQVIWSFFPNFTPTIGQPDLRYWCPVHDDKQRLMLTPFTLPHEEAQKLLAGANKEEMIIVKPGVKVTLDVNILGDEVRRQRVTDIMTKKLTDLGMSVAPDQPLHLLATLTQTGSKQEKYQKGNEIETINIPEYEFKIAFIKDGTPVWENSGHFLGASPGMFVLVKAGETLQGMVDKANANVGDFHFQNCRLPKYAARPIQPSTLSTFTANGIRATNMKS